MKYQDHKKNTQSRTKNMYNLGKRIILTEVERRQINPTPFVSTGAWSPD